MTRIRNEIGPLVVLALAVAVTGCKREPVTYSLRLDPGGLPRSATFRVTFRGTEVPLTKSEDDKELHGTFTAPAEQRLSQDVSALRVELDTPCGPAPFPYRSLGSSVEKTAELIQNQEKSFKTGGEPVDLPLWLLQGTPSTFFVHVDRREAADKEVSVGKQVLPKGAGLPRKYGAAPDPTRGGEVYEIAEPTCPEGKRVFVGGQDVGELGKTGMYGHALIDAKGGHCYTQTSFSYSQFRTSLPFMKPQEKQLSGSRAYVFDNGPSKEATDEFLTSCPSMLSGGRTSCTSVFPTECR